MMKFWKISNKSKASTFLKKKIIYIYDISHPNPRREAGKTRRSLLPATLSRHQFSPLTPTFHIPDSNPLPFLHPPPPPPPATISFSLTHISSRRSLDNKDVGVEVGAGEPAQEGAGVDQGPRHRRQLRLLRHWLLSPSHGLQPCRPRRPPPPIRGIRALPMRPQHLHGDESE